MSTITRLILSLLLIITVGAHRLDALDTGPAGIDAYNVTWDVPGPSSQESMPIGNGDIGLNLWCNVVEKRSVTSFRWPRANSK